MRAIVIANGHVGNSEANRAQTWPRDLVICADGGAQHALALGLAPDVVIGDMDSLDGDLQARLESKGCKVLVHPTRKDETDLELALRYAIDHGVDEILILGALGGRIDQTLANVLLLALPELERIRTRIVAGDQEMFLIRGQASIEGQVGDTISLLPIAGDVTGITTEGLEYPLQRGTLKFGPALGVSNVLTAPVARVQVERGLLVCVHISNRNGEWRAEKGGER
jgi:thiamine pyrophosphokinase